MLEVQCVKANRRIVQPQEDDRLEKNLPFVFFSLRKF